MKALTLQIGIFGRTNVGKSSLMNFITNQKTSIVSSAAGTTTDVVGKQMELNPLGAITLFDTAGLDDDSILGNARIEMANRAFDACDVVLLMCEEGKFASFEENIVKECAKRKTLCIIVIGKTDLHKPSSAFLDTLRHCGLDPQSPSLSASVSSNEIAEQVRNDDKSAFLEYSIIKNFSKHILQFSALNSNRDDFLNGLKKILVDELPENYIENYLSLRNIVHQGDTVILIMPIDKGAPRGKIIMPQIQTLRHILDLHACSYTVQAEEYETALQTLKVKPVLVITDSQAIKTVAQKTPKDIKLTTFSTIYSADKGDIIEMAKGAKILNDLKDGDKILIAEACTHHASDDDIGRVKLPKWIREFSKKELEINYVHGQEYPKDISSYRLIIHCGACTLNRKAMLSRINKALDAGIAITNYGIAISVIFNTIEKTLEVFPEALKAYK